MSFVVVQLDSNRPKHVSIDLESSKNHQIVMRYVHEGAKHV